MQISLRNGATGQIKLVTIGWSWTLFLFGTFYGIPLFIRRMPDLGIVVALITAVFLLIRQYDGGSLVEFFAAVMLLVVVLWLGLNGNRLTAVRYLKRGWFFAEPDSEATRVARATWNLDDTIGTPRPLSSDEQTRALVANAAANRRDNFLTVVGIILVVALVLLFPFAGDIVAAFTAPPD